MEAHLVNISQQLEQIWERLEKAGTMRASLFNLIVVAPDNHRRAYVQTITQNVTKRFPCRVIFITLSSQASDMQVTARAISDLGNVACDIIEITAPTTRLQKIPFLILPHFLPDLPIYLLWADTPSAHPALFDALQKWSTRLIYDSELADDLLSFCRALPQNKEVADLNWARTENWRELIAATFYSPARLASLQGAKKVEIHYNDFQTPFLCHTKIQALYIEAWLATCLKWSPAVTFHPQNNKELAPGTVISMEIFCQDQFHYAFSRDPQHLHQVRTLICDEEKCDIPSRYIFSKAQSGLSLVNLIYHRDPSTHFSKVIQRIAHDKR